MESFSLKGRQSSEWKKAEEKMAARQKGAGGKGKGRRQKNGIIMFCLELCDSVEKFSTRCSHSAFSIGNNILNFRMEL
jgi:hypothetical protein